MQTKFYNVGKCKFMQKIQWSTQCRKIKDNVEKFKTCENNAKLMQNM